MSQQHNTRLDILRGLAALLVVAFHFCNIYATTFDRNFNIGEMLHYNFPGHLSVLVFFILSGYVIAANTPQMTDARLVGVYVKKRLVRIVPIYFVGILLTAFVTFGKYGWPTFFSNLFFLSVPLDNVYVENGALWSLNYELLYYFVFIFISLFRFSVVRMVQVLYVMVVIVFGLFHDVAIHPLIISYLIGFMFWTTGAMLAERQPQEVLQVKGSRILAMVLLLFCSMKLNPYQTLLRIMHVHVVDYSSYSFFQKSIGWEDILYYPLMLVLLLALTNSYRRFSGLLMWAALALNFYEVLSILVSLGSDFIISQHYLVPIIFLLVSLLLWLLNFDLGSGLRRIIRSAQSFGSISYSLYIMHIPLIYVFGLTTAPNGMLFCVKVLTYFIVLFLVSYFLDAKFQVWLKGKLWGRHARLPQANA